MGIIELPMTTICLLKVSISDFIDWLKKELSQVLCHERLKANKEDFGHDDLS